MLRNYKGYLLLEGMIAMFVMAISILFTVSTIIFMVKEEKRCQDELEAAVFLFEMASATRRDRINHPELMIKSTEENIQIKSWQKNHLRIEGDNLLLDITRK